MKRMACVAASAAVLLAACGPGGGSKITKMIDSCATLKAVNATEVIGVDFEPPKSLRDYDGGEDAGKLSSCGLTSKPSASDSDNLADSLSQMRNTWFVTLMTWTWPNEAAAETYMDSMRQNSGGDKTPVDVSGLGDEAMWDGTMHARTGNVTVSLDVRGPADDEGEKSEKALETELARRALGNLK